MNKNKIIFIKFFLTTLLFIILPIFFLFSGAVYYNILKIKTNDINIEIKNELAEEINTLTEEYKKLNTSINNLNTTNKNLENKIKLYE